jgi:Flp pilus assembly protein TadD
VKKLLLLAALSAVSLSACAMNRTAPLAETGAYQPGALAVAAIERQDWARAELLLTDSWRGDVEDPGRLINLGKVYWETGRQDQARALWRRAAALDPVEVETMGGRSVTTNVLAREALASYGAGGPVVASRR